MSIYEIPEIVSQAWPLAATPTNIMNSFKKAGIYPYNPKIFTDEDFAPSFVTDRSMPETSQPKETTQHRGLELLESEDSQSKLMETEQVSELELESEKTIQHNKHQPGPSNTFDSPNILVIQSVSNIFSPETVKPFPKAPPRLSTTSRRRIRKSAILADAPEKKALAEEKAKRGNGKGTDKEKGKGIDKRKGKAKEKTTNSRDNAKRKVLQDNDSESDNEKDTLEWYCIICCDSYSNYTVKS